MRFPFLVFFLCSLMFYRTQGSDDASLAIVILTQPTAWHEQNAQQSKLSLLVDIPDAVVFDTVSDFGELHGAWAVWPLLSKLYHQLGGSSSTVGWVFLCEDGTVVKGKKLVQLIKKFDSTKQVFAGHALRDSIATIIHHFAFIGEDVSKFAYPDFAGGVLLSWPLMERLVSKLRDGRKPRDFAIDPKHELAMLIWDEGAGTELTDVPEFCTTITGDWCVTEFTNGDYETCPQQSSGPTTNDDVVFAVKTFHEFHKTRVAVVKRTWGLEARNIEFFSDREDLYIPTIPLEVENTERGHCSKTLEILRHFASNHAPTKKWLVIADDDTLINVPRLLQLLNCYDHTQSLMVGERYGFGFDAEGINGYGYPTGGSGMAFTKPAALQLAEKCRCPSPESPDDMILGVCAHRMNIHMIHSAALHQARPYDYASDYLNRTKPISFHKHWECDPYLVYSRWLASEEKQQADGQSSKEQSHSHDHGSEL